MEADAMEKEWEDFWVTGSIKDYLNYKNCYEDKAQKKEQLEGKLKDKETEESKVSWDRQLR